MAQSTDTQPTEHLRRVLVARFSAFGDVAMTIPVLYSVCRCHPQVQFTMVTRPAMTSMFVNAPENLTVVGVDLKTEYKGVRGIRRLCSMLVRNYNPDVFVDLHNVLRTRAMALFLRLNGIPCKRIYKARANRRALTRTRNKVMLPLTSQRARYREVFFKAGLPMVEKFQGLFGASHKAPSSGFVAITGQRLDNQRWVGIAPFAAHAGKIYPPEKMKRVVELITAPGGVHVFLFGGGEHEKSILDSWQKELPSVTSLAGMKLGFANELALMNHLDLMISMDSANMHLAAIAGTPTLSVWGATHPYCGFKAWRSTDADMIQLPVECRPCSVFGDKTCNRGDYLCLNAIAPELIASKALERLGLGKPQSPA